MAWSVALFCISLLTSCGGGNSTNGVQIYLTDAAIDSATSVNISLLAVSVTGDGKTFYQTFVTPPTVNFYQLQGGFSYYLINFPLPTGHYTAITLYFNAPPGTLDSNITTTGGGLYPMVIPDGSQTNISVPVNFIVFQNISASYTIDLDLRKSIYLDPSNPYQYILQPVMRAVDNSDKGRISGTVANTLFTSGCSAAVYLYSGKVTPTDVNINAPTGTVQPISSALVAINNTTGQFAFTIAFLPPGQYTAAFTCQAADDDPTKADNIQFTSTTTATVGANQTTFISLN
jgi:Domain of unknown function (DUF4382)